MSAVITIICHKDCGRAVGIKLTKEEFEALVNLPGGISGDRLCALCEKANKLNKTQAQAVGETND